MKEYQSEDWRPKRDQPVDVARGLQVGALSGSEASPVHSPGVTACFDLSVASRAFLLFLFAAGLLVAGPSQAHAYKLKNSAVKAYAKSGKKNKHVKESLRRVQYTYQGWYDDTIDIESWNIRTSRCYRDRNGVTRYLTVSCLALLTVHVKQQVLDNEPPSRYRTYFNVSPSVWCGKRGFVNKWEKKGCWVQTLPHSNLVWEGEGFSDEPGSSWSTAMGKCVARSFLRGNQGRDC